MLFVVIKILGKSQFIKHLFNSIHPSDRTSFFQAEFKALPTIEAPGHEHELTDMLAFYKQ